MDRLENLMFIIDYDRDRVLIHRVDFKNGIYLLPRVLKGETGRQVNDLILHMMMEKPDKIIFDEYGIGKMFADEFRKNAEKIVDIDEFNNIAY